MSRIDEALRRADLLAGVPGPVVPARTAASSVLENYPVEPKSAQEPQRQPEVVKTEVRVIEPLNSSSKPQPVSAPAQPVVAQRRLFGLEATSQDRLVIGPEASSLWIEQYRRLAASLYQAQNESSIKTIMVSSALPREGKTLTVANLALTLSESYLQRVLVIDADLRNACVHDVFGIPSQVGLGDYLRSTDSAPPVITVSPTLSVIVGGLPNNNHIAGLVSDRMKQLIEWASSRFDWVIVDTPPIGLLPDANLLARLTDAVVFVVAAAASPYSVIQRALTEVGPDRVLGVVLNRAAESVLPSSSQYDNYTRSAGPLTGSFRG